MITINLYPNVGNGEQLASLATTILRNYERAGEIIRTNTKPGSSERAAEHIIVALLGGHAVLQVAFARLSLVDDVGVVTVYSHREYGEAAYNTIREWLKNNGPSVEMTLMTWDKMPAVATLQELTRNE